MTVIEWGELLETSLPAGYLKVELLKDGDGREIHLSAVGERAEQLKDSFLTSVELEDGTGIGSLFEGG